MKPSFSLFALAACSLLMPAALVAPAHAQSALGQLPAPTKADETTDAFVWVMAPPVGSRWRMRTFTRTESSQITMGANAARVESVVLQRLVADYDVLSRDQFGATTTRLTYRDTDTDLTMKINGKTQPAINNRSLDELKRALVGASFLIKQAPNGEVWNVMGLEALQKRMLSAVTQGDPAVRAQIEKISKSFFSPDAARKMMGQTGTLPAYPIRAGESWAYAVELPVGLPMRSKISGTRTINLLTPDNVYVSDDAVYGGITGGAPIDIGNGNRMTYDMSDLQGGLLGTSRVNRTTGLTMESTIAQRLQGDMTFKQLDLVGHVKSAERVPLNIVTTGRITLEPR